MTNMTTADLINWPGAGYVYEDSGEGGMYAMLIVPGDPSDYSDACHVDVSILLSQPDVLISPEGKEVWGTHKYNAFHHDLYRHLVATDASAELQRAALRALDPDDFTWGAKAALHVGSTSQSLWHKLRMEYFRATPEDLTETGTELFKALEATYGRPPLLLTFLDT